MDDFRSLWPEYQQWVNDKTFAEDYYEAEMDYEDALAEALWLQHMEQEALDKEQAEEHYRQVAEAKRREREEKYPGVIFANPIK